MTGQIRFIESKDRTQIRKVFELAHKHRKSVTFWLKKQSLRFDARLSGVSVADGSASFHLPEDVLEKKFHDALAAQGSHLIFGTFLIDDVSFFFRTPLLVSDASSTKVIELPHPIYKLQRREDFRIPFRPRGAPKATMFDPQEKFDPDKPIVAAHVLAGRVLDLSVSGLGFAARPELAPKFKSGTHIHDLRFWLRAHEVRTDAVVQHVAKGVNDQGKPIIKVGVRFKALRPEDGRHIFEYVLDESRKVFQLLYGAK